VEGRRTELKKLTPTIRLGEMLIKPGLQAAFSGLRTIGGTKKKGEKIQKVGYEAREKKGVEKFKNPE